MHILRLVLQAAQRTRIYAPLFTRTVERRDAEIHGIEVTHGCGEEEEEEDAGEEKNGWAGNRNESSNTKGGGTKHVCAWRGRRGGTERLDFSDSEFCSSFFLPLLSLFLSVPRAPSHHRFTLSPVGDAHHVFPGVPFIPPPPHSFNHLFPPSSFPSSSP